jgi:hypothetical protein
LFFFCLQIYTFLIRLPPARAKRSQEEIPSTPLGNKSPGKESYEQTGKTVTADNQSARFEEAVLRHLDAAFNLADGWFGTARMLKI